MITTKPISRHLNVRETCQTEHGCFDCVHKDLKETKYPCNGCRDINNRYCYFDPKEVSENEQKRPKSCV